MVTLKKPHSKEMKFTCYKLFQDRSSLCSKLITMCVRPNPHMCNSAHSRPIPKTFQATENFCMDLHYSCRGYK